MYLLFTVAFLAQVLEPLLYQKLSFQELAQLAPRLSPSVLRMPQHPLLKAEKGTLKTVTKAVMDQIGSKILVNPHDALTGNLLGGLQTTPHIRSFTEIGDMRCDDGYHCEETYTYFLTVQFGSNLYRGTIRYEYHGGTYALCDPIECALKGVDDTPMAYFKRKLSELRWHTFELIGPVRELGGPRAHR